MEIDLQGEGSTRAFGCQILRVLERLVEFKLELSKADPNPDNSSDRPEPDRIWFDKKVNDLKPT